MSRRNLIDFVTEYFQNPFLLFLFFSLWYNSGRFAVYVKCKFPGNVGGENNANNWTSNGIFLGRTIGRSKFSTLPRTLWLPNSACLYVNLLFNIYCYTYLRGAGHYQRVQCTVDCRGRRNSPSPRHVTPCPAPFGYYSWSIRRIELINNIGPCPKLHVVTFSSAVRPPILPHSSLSSRRAAWNFAHFPSPFPPRRPCFNFYPQFFLVSNHYSVTLEFATISYRLWRNSRGQEGLKKWRNIYLASLLTYKLRFGRWESKFRESMMLLFHPA